MNLKKVQRTLDLTLAAERQLIAEVAQNQIEEYNFQRLILLGIIVRQVNISN